ncbi:MAG: tetratricopeptide (TPR) repeat protein [Candidatus Omnitrophota bacterium]|jgi:tetratricopeptide (TPR) repeat protein
MTDAFSKELNSLPEETLWHMDRAEGYLCLKMPAQALDCLKTVPPAIRSKGPFLHLLMQIAQLQADWPKGAQLAEELCGRYADIAGFWVQYAYAVRRSRGIPEAEKILKEAVGLFPGEAVFYYNLACYAAVSGRKTEAQRLLEKAIKLEPAYIEIGLDDEDLASLESYLESFAS